jgi:hypothetical protein
MCLIIKDDVWICGRIYNENSSNGGGGKLSEHNTMIQGSYVCSNSHSISLNLTNCSEYSLFPGQVNLINQEIISLKYLKF